MIIPRVLLGVLVEKSETFRVATPYRLERPRAQVKICIGRILYTKLSIRIPP